MLSQRLPKLFVIVLLITALALIAMHLITFYWDRVLDASTIVSIGSFNVDLGWWFNLNAERRFGAMFSTAILWLTGLLMLYAAVLTMPRMWMAIGWLFMACVLIFMGCDEFFRIHERTGSLLGSDDDFGTGMVPGWIKVMGVVVLILCIPMSVFWWNLPMGMKILTALSALMFLGGAVGVEIVSSTYVMNNGDTGFTYKILSAIEEGLEMLAIVLLIEAMRRHIGNLKSKPDKTRKPIAVPATTTA